MHVTEYSTALKINHVSINKIDEFSKNKYKKKFTKVYIQISRARRPVDCFVLHTCPDKTTKEH